MKSQGGNFSPILPFILLSKQTTDTLGFCFLFSDICFKDVDKVQVLTLMFLNWHYNYTDNCGELSVYSGTTWSFHCARNVLRAWSRTSWWGWGEAQPWVCYFEVAGDWWGLWNQIVPRNKTRLSCRAIVCLMREEPEAPGTAYQQLAQLATQITRNIIIFKSVWLFSPFQVFCCT